MKGLKVEINQNMVYAFEKPWKWQQWNPVRLEDNSLLLHLHMNICQVPSNMHVVGFWYKMGKKNFLFKEYLNGDFPKIVDNNECHKS